MRSANAKLLLEQIQLALDSSARSWCCGRIHTSISEVIRFHFPFARSLTVFIIVAIASKSVFHCFSVPHLHIFGLARCRCNGAAIDTNANRPAYQQGQTSGFGFAHLNTRSIQKDSTGRRTSMILLRNCPQRSLQKRPLAVTTITSLV